jgi:hypothetical protein
MFTMPGRARVPLTVSLRSAWPSLKMITALAPAVWALRALSVNGQVPRCSRATLPVVKPAKSVNSQPLVELGAGAGGSVTSIGWTGAVTSPLVENPIVRTSVPGE